MMSSEDWIRIFLDREKLSRLYHQALKDKKRKILDFLRKFNLEIIFAKLSLEEVIGDTTIDEMIEMITKQRRYDSVSEFVDHSLEPDEISKGQLTLIEAKKDLVEDITVFTPSGKAFPVLKSGSYLAYRSPFQKTIIFDGQYRECYLYEIVGAGGMRDTVKVLIKEHEGLDIPQMLVNWNNYHARVIGIVGNAPSYICRIRGRPSAHSLSKTNYAIYAMVVEVCPPKNMELAERLDLWRSWSN